MAECGVQEKLKDVKIENMQVSCIFHSKHPADLFCTKCQDVVCSRCLVEKHQKHPIQIIADANSSLRQKMVDWCSKREDTMQKLKDFKQQLESILKERKQQNSNLKGDIQKTGTQWKIKIENDMEILSESLDTNSDRCSQHTKDLITKIEFCERSMNALELETEAGENVAQLYQTVKASMNAHIVSDVENSVSVPTLHLSEPSTDVLIGRIGDEGLKPINQVSITNKKTKTSKREISVQTSDDEELLVSSDAGVTCVNDSSVEHKSLVRKISRQILKQTITKIVPVSEKEAWLLSDRKLYKMTSHAITMSSFTGEVDDIADIGNDNLLILNRQKSFIYKWNKNGLLSPFTSTDPYMPSCMDFIKDRGDLFVFQHQIQNQNVSSVVYMYDSYGTKRSCYEPKFGNNEYVVLSAYGNNRITGVCNDSKATGLRSQIFHYVIAPKDYWGFFGRFGCDPGLQFICKGVCHDAQGYIIVSDMQFHAIHKLNLDAKLQKTLLTFDDGLRNPTALALRDGFLWVADDSSIRVFKYDEIK